MSSKLMETLGRGAEMTDETAEAEALRSMANLIETNAPLEILHSKLKELKSTGISQQTVLKLLQQIRDESTSESKENLVLELMDFAHGFCSPFRRIWD